MSVVAPLMAAVVLVVLATVMDGAVLVLWLGAFALLVIAVAGAAAQQRRPGIRRSSRYLLATAFVVAAALGASVTLQAVDSASPSTADVPRVLNVVRAQESNVTPVANKPRELTYAGATRDVTDARAEAALGKLASTTSVNGQRAEAFVAAAKAADYSPESGLTQDFEKAVVQHLGAATYITVPLQGADIQDLTKVSYVYDGKTTTTVEMVASVRDESHAGMRVWQNGALIDDVQVYDPALDSTAENAGAQQVKFSMSKLKYCLNNSGVAAWLIALVGATCAVICVASAGIGCLPCVVGVLGFTSGSIAGCVRGAFL